MKQFHTENNANIRFLKFQTYLSNFAYAKKNKVSNFYENSRTFETKGYNVKTHYSQKNNVVDVVLPRFTLYLFLLVS